MNRKPMSKCLHFGISVLLLGVVAILMSSSSSAQSTNATLNGVIIDLNGTIVPGVTTGSSGEAFNARINGGLQMGDEAVMDGASMQQGFMNQSRTDHNTIRF